MESEIAVDAPLDYVTFQILPENRYGACICSDEKEEIVGDGPLERLLEHLPSIKDQIIEGSCDNFKLELPNSVEDRAWFTKATLMRFLHIIASSDAVKKSIAINNELSQLEETRKFHLSLYTQGDKNASSDNSKNELLRAMDSRIAALAEDMVSSFNLSAGAAFSYQEMIDLQKFCQHFGDVDLRNMLLKLSEKCKKVLPLVPARKKSPVPLISKSDYENNVSGDIKVLGQPTLLTPVQYNASPAKAAELERQSSTGSDESSFSSEDDQPSAAERSRTLIRSASPRRSASPMRKVQIGRSGSRRTPALTIKSLTHFPAREKISSYSYTGEESEEPTKKTEINVTRMSVQDAISLFESKQKDQTGESQKKSVTENSTNPTKAVLRRWSSGMSESQRSMNQDTTEHTALEINAEDEDSHRIKDVNPDTIPSSKNNDLEETIEFEQNKDIAQDDGPVCQTDETCEKIDSAEWSRQKEEELNKMLMKFAEYSMSNQKITEPDNKKNRISRERRSGGLDVPHKEKREEKLNEEKSGKRVEKQSVIRAKQRVPDKPKTEKVSAKASDIGKKLPASRTPNVNKSSPVSSSSKKESLKPAVPKKAPLKTSPLPATRKSWPSTPSPRVTGTPSPTVPTKSPSVTPSSITSAPRQKSQSPALRQKSQSPAPRQKPQSPAPAQRPSPKLEKPQLQQKDVKKQQIDTKKTLKKMDDSKSHVVPRSGKTARVKTGTTVSEEDTAAAPAVSPAKAVRKKVTKKSSVVPLEVKPSVRKVSEKSPAKNSGQKREIPSQVDEALSRSENPVNIVENVGTANSDTSHLMDSQESKSHGDLELEAETETETEKPEDGLTEKVVPVEAPTVSDDVGETISESPTKFQIHPAQELVISPAAWEESDHDQQESVVPVVDHSTSSLVNPDSVASAGTRVRHSLSQMLLEESSEPEIIEWGNAEHPPSMVYQKDAPKGLKRLLKFARKKQETNGAAWGSPYTSEGEDDGDEYRNLGKRNSDNLLKVALHSNYAEGFLSDSEPHSARSNTSNSSARSSNKFQDGNASTKGTRSFFSLSAFRGKN